MDTRTHASTHARSRARTVERLLNSELVGFPPRDLSVASRGGLEHAVSPRSSSSAVARHALHTLDAIITCQYSSAPLASAQGDAN